MSSKPPTGAAITGDLTSAELVDKVGEGASTSNAHEIVDKIVEGAMSATSPLGPSLVHAVVEDDLLTIELKYFVLNIDKT